MTTALLIIIVLIELARLALQYQQGKAYKEQTEKTYCTTSEIRNICIKAFEDQIQNQIDLWSIKGYEIASAVYTGYNNIEKKRCYLLLFTRKKIKNFVENIK